MSILDASKYNQVGYVVHDIEKSKRDFARLFGCEAPPTWMAGAGEARTLYHGEPIPDARVKQAFFDLSPGVQLELLEPNEVPSTWRDWLNEHGEGVHHLAFQVEGMDGVIQALEAEGMRLLQIGNYDDGTGRYAYLDGGKDFAFVVELLESFR